MKTIVSDEAPSINADDNELLRIENEKKKEILSAAKARLAEKYSDVRTLAPLVEQGSYVLHIHGSEFPLNCSRPSHYLHRMLEQTTIRRAH